MDACAQPLRIWYLWSQVADVPFREPFVRSFLLGIGSGLLLEGAHVLMQVGGQWQPARPPCR